MTFKQAIQIQLKAFDKIYQNAEGLKQVSTQEERDALNYVQSHIPKISAYLMELAEIPDSLDRSLKADYSISVKLEDVL